MYRNDGSTEEIRSPSGVTQSPHIHRNCSTMRGVLVPVNLAAEDPVGSRADLEDLPEVVRVRRDAPVPRPVALNASWKYSVGRPATPVLRSDSHSR